MLQMHGWFFPPKQLNIHQHTLPGEASIQGLGHVSPKQDTSDG